MRRGDFDGGSWGAGVMSDMVTIATAGVEGNDLYLTFFLIGRDTSQNLYLH